MVVGMARSGIAAVKALKKIGCSVIINDSKDEEQLESVLKELSGFYDEKVLGGPPSDFSKVDILVLSPGVPTDLSFVLKAKEKGIEVIGELELAYRLSKGTFYGITGTNGKTTTTALVGEIFSSVKDDVNVVGNIGMPVIGCANGSTDESVFITEVSSFQLETISAFKTKISAILNITPDHLNRHKTMENYIAAKCEVFRNQTMDDFLILNYDNEGTKKIGELVNNTKVIYFSRKDKIPGGIYLDNGVIVVDDVNTKETVSIIKKDEIFILGDHNVENVLAAVGISYYGGIAPADIKAAIMNFKGVEHRIEYVGEVEGVRYYNDSKGTNPEASIVAIKAMNSPTFVIAGGMDKGSEFDGFINEFGKKVKEMIVLGETSEILIQTAKKLGFDSVKKVSNLDEAVRYASEKANDGDAVLLSPACASWDMYESFEHRGEHFKRCVNNMR
jgi:UDP-N-acetylmuramoylalanine--D-glutamate ligase